MQAIERRVVDTAALAFSYFVVPWDTAIFGDRVVQIEGLQLKRESAAAEVFAEYERWAQAGQVALEVCKLPAGSLSEVAWLQRHGFRWIETMYYPAMLDLQALSSNDTDAELLLRPMAAAELPEVQAIAAQAFVTSRFSIDPHICKQRGASRYATWVRNSASDPGQQVLVAELDGAMAGFFIVQEREVDGCRQAYWHLTAIASGFQGRGLGKRLWRKVMQWHRSRGCLQLRTAISGHNLPVIGLYGQLGFRFERAEVTLHRGGLPPILQS